MNLLRRLRSNQRGMSATETSVFLLAASLVTSAGAPAVDDYANLAREIKVQSERRRGVDHEYGCECHCRG